MYMNAENIASLPQVLNQKPAQGPGRRRQIGQLRLHPLGLDRFNQLLASLGRVQPMDCDQIVTAARGLVDGRPGDTLPPCIAGRLRQAEAMARMLADSHWTAANEAVPSARAALDYVQGQDDLIPDWVPQVGRLDDAIVIDTVWPRLSAEVLSYLDFCRLRLIEASLRGADPVGFRYTRSDWEISRQAEAALRAQQRRVREGSYVPSPLRHFRVH